MCAFASRFTYMVITGKIVIGFPFQGQTSIIHRQMGHDAAVLGLGLKVDTIFHEHNEK